ncbi:hypothetical protein NOL04_02460 [Streptococcus suis]|uniref:hypothetical protein n=1 Tax=Streptococcus suis TaxID=1307 RepID=UPI0005CB6A12|nr:hypothetical protein [Streptococcus suis]MDG4513732.1 hypothetical protein [Streptococcus suis]CYY65952.1 phage protein [Streptococcus suis]HEL1906678.1 hypothetical protein [Streptococcus suis]
MTPNHALFRRLFAISNIRVDTYDFLPDAKSAYPFVYIGENNGSDSPNKDLLGRIRQTVHLYGLRTDRANLDDISAYLESEVKRAHDGYDYHLYHVETSKQIIPDNTDVQPLLHIVLDFTFDYTKKEN